jgi:putative ABC transport system substrate-binding protein
MRRRTVISALAAAAAVWPLVSHAQQRAQKIPRVGYLFSFIPAEGEHLWHTCQQGLRDLGYVEGRTIVLEPRFADGRHERLPELVAELLRLEVDVIVAAATPAARAAKLATTTIPIVFVAVGEPVKAGLVQSLARPGGNVTGLSLLTSDMSGKRLQLLAELSRPSRVVALMNPDNPVSAIFFEETEVAARSLGIALQPADVRNAGEIERAFASAGQAGADALIVFDDPVIWSHRAQIVALAAKARLPALYGYRDFVDGGLVSYGPDRPNQYRQTAAFVDKILKGARPTDLPVQQPTRFELVLNLRTAKALGLTIPPAIRLRATEVIE